MEEIAGLRCFVHSSPAIGSEADALELVAGLWGQGVDLVVVPVEALGDDFFRLSSGLAGAVLQKLQNYGFRVAIVGDISRWTSASPALADFIGESNRRGQVMFFPSRTELSRRLRA
jgi:hypothetical protein